MANFTDSLGSFQTGDIVFVRYPPRGTQPIHVTVFLDAKAPGGAGYLHAGDKTLEKDSLASYEEYKDYGGYLHACTTNADLRTAVAEVARIFTLDATKATPYGHYPNKDDVARVAGKPVESPRANRFGGMIATRNVSEIPFEFPALHRLLKWSYRAMVKAPLSENRGITCAAFAAACHQVAGMRAFLVEVGLEHKPDKVRGVVHALDEFTVTKADLRKGLEKIGDDSKTGKTIYKGQALPANSNRVLSAEGLTKVKDMLGKKQDDKYVGFQEWTKDVEGELDVTFKDLSKVEMAWMAIQHDMFELQAFQMKRLSQIIDPAFFFDAKYVSSPALAAALVGSGSWKTTEYKTY